MASKPRAVPIRNQRYPRWVLIAENVVVGGMLVAFLVIEIVGLWLFGVRTAMLILLAAFLAILPIAIYGWFQIWDLSRPGPGRGVTARALFDGVFRGIRRKELAAAVEWSALTALRSVFPSVHTVFQLKLGEEIEVRSFRYPRGVVKRVRFAPDPGEDFKECEPARPLRQATVEIHSGRQFQLIVDETDAKRLQQWAETKGIIVCDSIENGPRTTEPVQHA